MSQSEMKDAYKCQYADETSLMTLESRICTCSIKSNWRFVFDAIWQKKFINSILRKNPVKPETWPHLPNFRKNLDNLSKIKRLSKIFTIVNSDPFSWPTWPQLFQNYTCLYENEISAAGAGVVKTLAKKIVR